MSTLDIPNQIDSDQLGQAQQHHLQCVICLEDLDQSKLLNNNEYYHSRCGHITHSSCLQTNVRAGNYNCPLCRQSLGDISVELANVEKRLHRYVKMLKSGLNQEAIRQRMVVDGIPLSMIDAFFTGGASRSLGDDLTAVTEDREALVQKLYEKYQKLLDMGMPEGAVRQKMLNSSGELTKEEIDHFFSKN